MFFGLCPSRVSPTLNFDIAQDQSHLHFHRVRMIKLGRGKIFLSIARRSPDPCRRSFTFKPSTSISVTTVAFKSGYILASTWTVWCALIAIVKYTIFAFCISASVSSSTISCMCFYLYMRSFDLQNAVWCYSPQSSTISRCIMLASMKTHRHPRLYLGYINDKVIEQPWE